MWRLKVLMVLTSVSLGACAATSRQVAQTEPIKTAEPEEVPCSDAPAPSTTAPSSGNTSEESTTPPAEESTPDDDSPREGTGPNGVDGGNDEDDDP